MLERYQFDYGYADLEMAINRPYMWTITALLVEDEYRGLGIGSALMGIICRDADLQGVELWVVPQSIENRQEELIKFYESFGFVKLGHSSGYMRREAVPAHEPNAMT